MLPGPVKFPSEEMKAKASGPMPVLKGVLVVSFGYSARRRTQC